MLNVEITVKGQMNERWADWFEGMTITHSSNQKTMIKGAVTDEAALYGLLTMSRDLGLKLLSVNSTRIDPENNPGS